MASLGQAAFSSRPTPEDELHMTVHDHFIERCEFCGTLLRQCRCPGPNKQERQGTCADCERTALGNEIRDLQGLMAKEIAKIRERPWTSLAELRQLGHRHFEKLQKFLELSTDRKAR